MARPLRLEFAGALYHITSRGDRREDIFEDDDDRIKFLSVLQEVCGRYNWICHAYCLMSNHYHLLIETPDSNLSKGMRQLNGVYTQHFNRHHDRVGHVFQGRYKAILVDKNNYLLELARTTPESAGYWREPKQVNRVINLVHRLQVRHDIEAGLADSKADRVVTTEQLRKDLGLTD